MTDQDQQLPLLPLRDVVVYPNMVLPFLVGRERSIGRWRCHARQQAGFAGGAAKRR